MTPLPIRSPLAAIVLLALLPAQITAQACWTEKARMQPSGPYATGEAVALDGDLALTSDGLGTAHVFRFDGTTWNEEAVLTPSDGNPADWFGYAVALIDDLVVVGSPKHGSHGAVYLYRFDGSQWNQEAKLTTSDGSAGAEFGHAVATDGSRILVGARAEDTRGSRSGAAYFYHQSGGQWVLGAKFLPDSVGEWFGYAVSMDGSRAVVTSAWKQCLYVYKNPGRGWVQEAKLEPSDRPSGAGFGESVTLDGIRIAVGAPEWGDPGPYVGAVYVYRLLGGQWNEEARLLASDGKDLDFFGASVGLSGNWLLVGTPGHRILPWTPPGSLYGFQWDLGAWQERFRADPSGTAANDKFGASAAVDDARALVGAPDPATDGDAYVFELETLSLSVSSNQVQAGDAVQFLTVHGEPGNRMLLGIVSVDGMAMFQPLTLGRFDGNGDHSYNLTVPIGLSGVVFQMQTLGFSSCNGLDFSNQVTVTVQ